MLSQTPTGLSMPFYVAQGMDTGIEKINGWLIERGRQYGLRLPTHEMMMDRVIAKTLERRTALYAPDQASNADCTDKASPDRDSDDRVDLKRPPKQQRHLPETYIKPQITPAGNLGLRLERNEV